MLQIITSFAASVQAAKSVQAISVGDGLRAIKSIEFAEKLSPRVSTYPRMKAEYLNLWIKANPKTRSILEPIISSELKKSLELNPLYFRHYLKTSAILKDLNYIEQAVTAYEQAIVLVPNSVKLRNGLASLYTQAGRYQESEEQLEIALKITNNSPWSYETYYVAAYMYQSQGKREAAIGALLTSLDVAPNSPLCYVIIKQLGSTVNNFDSIYRDHEKCGYYLEAEHKRGS